VSTPRKRSQPQLRSSSLLLTVPQLSPHIAAHTPPTGALVLAELIVLVPLSHSVQRHPTCQFLCCIATCPRVLVARPLPEITSAPHQSHQSSISLVGGGMRRGNAATARKSVCTRTTRPGWLQMLLDKFAQVVSLTFISPSRAPHTNLTCRTRSCR
jgi:hypothetical protein